MTGIHEIEDRIEKARQSLVAIFDGAGAYDTKTSAAIARWQSEIAIALSQIAEISTRRIVSLTRWIVGLTIGLFILTLVLAVFTICLYQDTHADAHDRELAKHHQLQAPPPQPQR
jgi:hypothetical protein